MIKLQITKTEKNANFNEEMKQWEKDFGYMQSRRNGDMYGLPGYPTPENVETIMQVAITEEQFEAIRKAVLEKF